MMNYFLVVKCNILDGAVGSSYIEMGETKVICSVFVFIT